MVDDSALLGELAEEFSAKVRAGQSPSIDDYASRYPGLAARIQSLFPTLMLLEGMAGTSPNQAAVAKEIGPGTVFGPYRIVREVGRGGMGVVYEAMHLALDRRVALKVLPAASAGAAKLERFLREAQTAAALHHTNIVPVFDVGQVGGVPYYAMQFIEGTGLDRVTGSDCTIQFAASKDSPAVPTVTTTAAAPPPIDYGQHFRWVANLGIQAAEALAYAHARGVVHRDIKPSNLLLDGRGILWITDFGLARRLEDVDLTRSGVLLGTPRYMSPEQAEASKKQVDHRTDIYSLGVTLYEVLLRRPAFDGRTPQEVVNQILDREPAPPRRLEPKVPRDLETIILKAMAKRPEDRYASAPELGDDLRRYLNLEPVRARRIGPIGRLARWCRRNPRLAIVTGVSAAIIIAILVMYFVHTHAHVNQTIRLLHNEQAALEQARMNADESRRRLVRQYVGNGARHLEQRDYLGALPWFVQAMELEAGDSEREHIHRVRIGAILRRAPRLMHVWTTERPQSALVFSPDSRWIAAGGTDSDNCGLVRVRDVDSGKDVVEPLRMRLPGEMSSAWAPHVIVFNHDGNMLAAANSSVVSIWELPSGRKRASFAASDRITQMAFRQDNQRLMAIWSKNIGRDVVKIEARTWDVTTGEPASPVITSASTFNDNGDGNACFSPDGTRLAMTDDVQNQRVIRLIDVESGKDTVPPLQPAEGSQVLQAHFMPDGQVVLGAATGAITMWETATGKLIRTVSCDGITCREFMSQDGARFMTLGVTVSFFDRDGGPDGTLSSVAGSFLSARLSGNGLRVVTQVDDGGVQLWNTLQRQPIGPILRLPRWTELRLSHDGRFLMASLNPNQIGLWDFGITNEDLQRIDVVQSVPGPTGINRDWPERHAISPDGRSVALVRAGCLRLLNPLDGNDVTEWAAYRGRAILMQFSGDGRRIRLVTMLDSPPEDAGQAATYLYDAESGRRVGDEYKLGGFLLHTMDRRLRWLGGLHSDAAAGYQNALVLFDLHERSMRIVTRDNAEARHGIVAFSSDGSRYLARAPGDQMRAWDAMTGKPVGPPFHQSNFCGHAQFAADNRTVALVYSTNPNTEKSNRARLWDVETGSLIHELAVHNVAHAGVTFSADGRQVLTAAGSMARIWDVATGKPLTMPMPTTGQLADASFSQDGRFVITSRYDNRMQVWDAVYGEPVTPMLTGRSAAMNAHGRLILVDDAIRVIDLTPDNRPIEELRRLAHLLSGHRVDEAGGYVPFADDEFARLWQDYPTKYGDGQARSVEQELIWRADEAIRAEEDEQFDQVVRHCEPLIKAYPQVWQWRARRARAYARLEKWDEALVDFSALPDRPDVRVSIVWDRANVLAELGRLREAARDLERIPPHQILHLDPSIAFAWLGVGDQDAYRKRRDRIVRFLEEEARGHDPLADLVWPLVAVPDPAMKMSRAIALLEKSITAPPDPGQLRALGAALFRQGKNDEAIQRLQEAAKLQESFPSVWMFLALAHQKAGRTGEARKWRDEAFRRLDEPSGLQGVDWRDRVALKVLRQEVAKAVPEE